MEGRVSGNPPSPRKFNVYRLPIPLMHLFSTSMSRNALAFSYSRGQRVIVNYLTLFLGS